MKKKDAMLYAGRISRLLQVLVIVLAVLLCGGQYLILTSGESDLTRLGAVEGETLGAAAEEELFAGTGRDKVYDVRLTLAANQSEMLRIYVNDRLLETIAGGESKTMALEAGQRLCADGALLTAPAVVKMTVEQSKALEATIVPGGWEDLAWENNAAEQK